MGAKAAMDPWFGALATVPMALYLVYVPHFVKFAAIIPHVHVNYDNVTPRYTNWDETIKSKPAAEFVKRCVSCHQNNWEAFIAFAPAVILCRLQKADGKTVRELCLKFIKLRALYTILYIAGAWKIVSVARTIVWTQAFQTILSIYGTALLA